MEETLSYLLSTKAGKVIAVILALAVGAILNRWTYRRVYHSGNKTAREDRKRNRRRQLRHSKISKQVNK